MSTATDKPHILVIDDEPDLRTLYEMSLLKIGCTVVTESTFGGARLAIESNSYDAIISDMRLPDGLGIDLLPILEQLGRTERCIIITAYGSQDGAVEALKAGAFDYLSKPVDLNQLRTVLTAAIAEKKRPQQPPDTAPATAAASTTVPPSDAASLPAAPSATAPDTGGSTDTPAGRAEHALQRIVGFSVSMQAVRERIAKVARGMAPVFIRGESGTGKELVANAVHACSQRSSGPFVAVNCGAVPENLLEAEFFGAKKGSYTGATSDREGVFQAAAGGTLFLDEIGDLPLSMQAKLLRAIQERKIRPLGETREQPVDVRIVSATHHDLAANVQAGLFRQDLFYRLNVIDIILPPLRDRREDLPFLCKALLKKITSQSGLEHKPLSQQAIMQLMQHPLSGNVRELENLLQRALALSEGDELELDLSASSSIPAPVPAPATSTVPPAPVAAAATAAATAPASVPAAAAAGTGTAASPAVSASAPPIEPPVFPPAMSASTLPTAATASTLADLASQIPEGAGLADIPLPDTTPQDPLPRNLQAYMDNIERDILIRALRAFDFNRTAAAEHLGISLRQMRYRIKQLEISEEECQ